METKNLLEVPWRCSCVLWRQTVPSWSSDVFTEETFSTDSSVAQRYSIRIHISRNRVINLIYFHLFLSKRFMKIFWFIVHSVKYLYRGRSIWRRNQIGNINRMPRMMTKAEWYTIQSIHISYKEWLGKYSIKQLKAIYYIIIYRIKRLMMSMIIFCIESKGLHKRGARLARKKHILKFKRNKTHWTQLGCVHFLTILSILLAWILI